MRLEREEHLRAWIALASIDGVGDVLCLRLARRFGGPEGALAASFDDLRTEARPALANAIRRFRGWDEVDRTIARARRAGATILCHDDPDYPPALRFTFDPPPVVYVRGRLEPADRLALAIVGARDATPYGLDLATTLARDLAARGLTIVSGLAIGIDGAAHRGALAAGGRTIAVLACGIDQVYPRRHVRLAEEIAGSGAVVTEFPPGTPPEPGRFPRRNRIVSGLGFGVVVVEAGEKSGSLVTARLALEQGREVLAVPGEANRPRTRGTHRLLREGAALVERAEDVLAAVPSWLLEKPGETVQTRPLRLAGEAERVLAALDEGVVGVDRLVARSGLPTASVMEILLQLEIDGIVRRHPGSVFTRADR